MGMNRAALDLDLVRTLDMLVRYVVNLRLLSLERQTGNWEDIIELLDDYETRARQVFEDVLELLELVRMGEFDTRKDVRK